MLRPGESNRAVLCWLARAIPASILCVFGVGSYAVVWRCCGERPRPVSRLC